VPTDAYEGSMAIRLTGAWAAGDHPTKNAAASGAQTRVIARSNANQRNRRDQELPKSGGMGQGAAQTARIANALAIR
jgi:hypothetical protein